MNANNNQTESATGISDAVSSPSTSDKAPDENDSTATSSKTLVES